MVDPFLAPASVPRLVKQRPWYVLSCLWDDAYKRSLAANRQRGSSLAVWMVLWHMYDAIIMFTYRLLHPSCIACRRTVFHPSCAACGRTVLHPSCAACGRTVLHPSCIACRRTVLHPSCTACGRTATLPMTCSRCIDFYLIFTVVILKIKLFD